MEILSFKRENLAIALKNDYTPTEAIFRKKHFEFLFRYLGIDGLQAGTIVIEEDYINRDYLHDYLSYYALCKEPYKKTCKRVHFFMGSIDESELEKKLLERKEDNKEFWSTYLGFIVVKPIPWTIIGLTILKDYNYTKPLEGRQFWGTRKYKIHFFGIKLEIRAVAFQEQDNVLAACATTAVWSMLQVAANNPYTILKTPSQITSDADLLSHDGSRLFPNKGLSIMQICKAVLGSGLDTEQINPSHDILDEDDNVIGSYVPNLYTKKILNAYSQVKVPVILVIEIPIGNEKGLHAVAVCGHKMAKPQYYEAKDDISWAADDMERVYAHDDQWGPYARIDFSTENDFDIITEWTRHHDEKEPTRVTNIIIPMYPKIRISYGDIEEIVLFLDGVLSYFFDSKIRFDLRWDIRLDFSEEFKHVIKNSQKPEHVKLAILKESLPKYIWIATCSIGETTILEFTFDATGVKNAMLGIHLCCNLAEDYRIVLLEHLKINEEEYVKSSNDWSNVSYYRFMLEQLEKCGLAMS